MAAYNQSRIKLFRRCQKAYSFRYDTKPGQEMVPRVPKVGLRRGSWLHELIEAHHRNWAGEDINWRDVHERNSREFEGYFVEEQEELGDLPSECFRIFRSYLRFWRADADSFEVAMLKEGGPAIEFNVEVPLDKWGISSPFKGRIDLLVRDLEYGGLWIWDHKWMKMIPRPDERMMSPQALMYAWALRKLGYDIRGFLFNYGRTKPPTIPRVLKNGSLSMAKRMDTDYSTYLTAIKENHGEQWKLYAKKVYRQKLLDLKGREQMWFNRQRIPVEPARIKRGLAEFLITIKDIERRNMKHPPRSYFFNCPFTCEYHDPCVAEFQGLDIEPLIKKSYIFEGERYGETTESVL